MHRRLKLLKLEDRRELHMHCLCHKNIYCDSKTGLDSFFVKVEERARVTRSANNMNMMVKGFKTEKGRQAFAYRGPICWNKLSNELKNCHNFNSFKRQLMARYTSVWDNHPT